MSRPTSGDRTPLDRLRDRLATDRCDKCGRADLPELDAIAAAVGLSETTVRRLAEPTPPSWPTIRKLAAALGQPPTAVVGLLWPDLAAIKTEASAVTVTEDEPTSDGAE